MDYLLSLDMGKNKISDISSHLDKKLFLQQLNFDYNQLEQFNLTQLPILAWLNLSRE
jgi:Leucine-rich repeat (LRR) protein